MLLNWNKIKEISCPRRGGPVVWDLACMLMVPCSSRGGYHVRGGDFHGMHCAPHSGSLGMLG